MSTRTDSNGAVCLNSQLPLFRSLVPRAQLFVYFNGSAMPAWNGSEEHYHHVTEAWQRTLARQVEERGAEDGGVALNLPSGGTAYAFDVQTSTRKSLGTFITVLPTPHDGEPQAVTTVGKLIAPALRVFTREIQTAKAMEVMKRDIAVQRAELELLYGMEGLKRGERSLQEELRALLEHCVTKLRVNMLAVIVPERNLQLACQNAREPIDDAPSMVRRLRNVYPKLTRDPRTMNLATRPKPAAEQGHGEAGDDSEPVQYSIVACPLKVGGGRMIGMLALVDRPDRGRLSDRGERIAELITRRVQTLLEDSYDSLTGIVNRREFEARVKATLASGTARHAVMHLDIDKLHVVNDTFGHAAGDEVIMRITTLLRDRMGPGDEVARLSGDCFGILLPDTRVESACEVAEGILEGARNLHYVRGENSVRMSASIGIVSTDSDSVASEVMAAAEVACKAAKDHGRNRVEVFDVGDSSIIRRHSELHVMHAVNRALETDAFELYAQRIDQLDSEQGHRHYELLLRLVGDNGKIVLPAEFLPTAERYQTMPEIDRWVIKQAFRQIAEVRETVSDARAIFAINLSGQSLGDDAFLEFVEARFDEARLPPELICFEITETAAVANLNKARQFIEQLRLRGCRFSLDDFGAGLSSFAYLKSLPVDFLKIDGGFVRDIDDSRVSESMVVAIQQVARIMELKTIAEGVENSSTCTRLRAIGVDYVQGFGIERPVPLTDLLARLADTVADGALDIEADDKPHAERIIRAGS